MNGKSRTKKILQIAFIAILCFSLVGVIIIEKDPSAVEALSSYSARGSEVVSIQTKLKNLGFYKGSVDGVFGVQTSKAVKAFQKSKGLTPDGVAGAATLRALGISTGSGYGKYSSSDVNLLARLISAEARGEPYVGQVAVGAVVLNRVEHPSFPNTIAGVIYQPGAFTCLQDGQFNQPVASSAYRAAQDALNGWDPSNGSIYYYNPATATSKWIWSRPVLLKIGKHVFCR